MQPVFITPAIRKATEALNLTKWGQIRLTVFSDEVLNSALADLSVSRTIKDPFAWFFNVCRRHSDIRKIKLDWNRSNFLRDNYKMPVNANMTLKKEPVAPQPKKYVDTFVLRELPKEDPKEIIHQWEKWLSSIPTEESSVELGENTQQRITRLLVEERLISPFVKKVIDNREISDEDIEYLFIRYSFLGKYITNPTTQPTDTPQQEVALPEIVTVLAGILTSGDDKVNQMEIGSAPITQVSPETYQISPEPQELVDGNTLDQDFDYDSIWPKFVRVE